MGDINVVSTLGAILVGCLLCVALSALVFLQTIIYFYIYRQDLWRIQLIVGTVWALDATHVALTCTATWTYLVLNFGNEDITDFIPITSSIVYENSSACVHTSQQLGIAFTGLVGFIVQAFFTHRVFRLSNNRVLASILIVMTVVRLGAALVTTIEMMRLKSFGVLLDQFAWSISLGLALSSALDLLLSASLSFYLRSNKTGFGTQMDRIVSAIILYTINTGMLTSMMTVSTLICWLVIPNNCAFLAMHFAVSKLHANSLLTTLNTRKVLQEYSKPRFEVGTHQLDTLPRRPSVLVFRKPVKGEHYSLDTGPSKAVERDGTCEERDTMDNRPSVEDKVAAL
ncbi:lep6-lignin expressed protein 6 [Heterobasidion irregulare TC 32-1]|uniref:Lep6-lignin expressed protein 6 n=1 Tax=Heterobasidion irregulare (strain TC 32-1) TaxID=747525 RepID=W4JRY9_HETIT|nr:lep6-lignin expressed protein 6 [Heterobasidion irregulare TC 32-1]ETW75651.1 lep6-lignin expressed protein 6 [Heterobasidion irregulare TC 32-1]